MVKFGPATTKLDRAPPLIPIDRIHCPAGSCYIIGVVTAACVFVGIDVLSAEQVFLVKFWWTFAILGAMLPHTLIDKRASIV